MGNRREREQSMGIDAGVANGEKSPQNLGKVEVADHAI